MTHNHYTHDGVTYIGVTSYDFGEMLYSFAMAEQMCSRFAITRTAFCHPKYGGSAFQRIYIYAHSKSDCVAHLDDNIDNSLDNGLRTYRIDQEKLYSLRLQPYTVVNLCKSKDKRKRILII